MKQQSNLFFSAITEQHPLGGPPQVHLHSLKNIMTLSSGFDTVGRISLGNVLPFSCKSCSNKVDVRRSSRAPLPISLAHYLLITGNLKGMKKMHSEKYVHVLLIASRARVSEYSHFGIFCQENKHSKPCLHAVFLVVQLNPAQHKTEHLLQLGAHKTLPHRHVLGLPVTHCLLSQLTYSIPSFDE